MSQRTIVLTATAVDDATFYRTIDALQGVVEFKNANFTWDEQTPSVDITASPAADAVPQEVLDFYEVDDVDLEARFDMSQAKMSWKFGPLIPLMLRSMRPGVVYSNLELNSAALTSAGLDRNPVNTNLAAWALKCVQNEGCSNSNQAAKVGPVVKIDTDRYMLRA